MKSASKRESFPPAGQSPGAQPASLSVGPAVRLTPSPEVAGVDGSTHPIILERVTYAIGRKTILKDISLAVGKGEIYVVMGLSGSGKTTLLRLMIGLAKPSRGRVWLFGNDTSALSEEELNRLRRRMGMVFQYSALFDSITVGRNVAFPLREHTHLSRAEIERVVAQKLSQVGLPGTENLLPTQLSGGMKKRVGVARALALDPEVMLYDEPTSGLDTLYGARINRLILELRQRLGVTSVVVTHDPEVARLMADCVGVIHEGTMLAEGTPQQVCSSEDGLVQQLMHCRPEGPLALDLLIEK